MRSYSTIKTLCLFVTLFSIISCSTRSKQQYIDEIKATDVAFSKLSEKEGMHKAFLKYIAEDGVMLKPNSFPIVGKTVVSELFAKGDDSSFQLTWEPQFADASDQGDMGYSYGVYTLVLSDTTVYGTYVSVWKNFNGTWRWVLDSGNDGLGNEIN